MSTFSISENMIDPYVSFLLKLKPTVKLRIAAKLKSSVLNEKPKTVNDNLFGAWIDDRTTDEIISDSKEFKTKNNDISFE